MSRGPVQVYPAGSGLASPFQLAALAKKAGFPDSQIPTAVAVALAESAGRVNAAGHNTNGTTDHGLWQINDVNLGANGVASAYASDIASPLANAQAAYAVWKSSGWGAWSTYSSGAYKRFWPQAVSGWNTASAGTVDQLAGALLPLLGIAAGAALPEAAGGAGAGAAGVAAGETAAAGGGIGAAAGYASKALNDLSTLAKGGGIAALLVDPHFLFRALKIVGGLALGYLAVKQLASAGTGGS